MRSPEVFADIKCELGESPVWDDRKQGLYWLDILERKLFFKAIKPLSPIFSWTLPSVCSAIFLIANVENRLLCISADGVGVFDLQSCVWSLLVTSGDEALSMRSNDAGIDPFGNVWYGTMSSDPLKEAGNIYRWRVGQGRPVKEICNIHIPNTFVWSQSGAYLFFADSLQHKIFRMHYDKLTGEVHLDREIVNLTEEGFEPDGSAIDSFDRIWNAQWNGSRVACYDIDGFLLDQINLPVSRPTSCCFGGADLNKLFITSSSAKLDRAKEPNAGAVFVIDLESQGRIARRVEGLQ